MSNNPQIAETGGEEDFPRSRLIDLRKALAAFHRDLESWKGVPAAEPLAEALSIVKAAYMASTGEEYAPAHRNYLGEAMRGPDHVQRGNILALLDGVVAALVDKTSDGWKLRLSGPKGRHRSSGDFEEELEIAEHVMERMKAGDGYESAVADAGSRFLCKPTKIKDAYSKHCWFLAYLSRLNHKSPELALQIFMATTAEP